MLVDLESKLNKLNVPQRQMFYEMLAHNLTISVRFIQSEEKISVEERLDRIKWINEIMHRVISKIRCLRLNTHEWTEEDSVNDMRGWIKQNEKILKTVEQAVNLSLNVALKTELS